MIAKPGMYELDMAAYQGDPCPSPSLSSGTANRLLGQSPLHAWWAHPRLNPKYRRKDATELDLGSCAHDLLLEGEKHIAAIDFPDWRKKEAQLQRDAARASGKIPVLVHKLEEARLMASIARDAIASLKDPVIPFDGGYVERSLFWQEGETWCRARPDWMSKSRSILIDYKTTAGRAEPNAWTRNQMVPLGYDVQAVHYLRGNKNTGGGPAQWLFLVQENYPPFACAFVGLSPSMREIAERKWEEALALWRECLKRNTWNGYPLHVAYAEPTSWQIDESEERRLTLDERLEYALA